MSDLGLFRDETSETDLSSVKSNVVSIVRVLFKVYGFFLKTCVGHQINEVFPQFGLRL